MPLFLYVVINYEFSIHIFAVFPYLCRMKYISGNHGHDKAQQTSLVQCLLFKLRICQLKVDNVLIS